MYDQYHPLPTPNRALSEAQIPARRAVRTVMGVRRSHTWNRGCVWSDRGFEVDLKLCEKVMESYRVAKCHRIAHNCESTDVCTR